MKETVIDITALGPDWAHGCPKCQYGIVQGPPIAGLAELYLERLAHALAGDIEFCDCMAGQRYRVGLLNRRQHLLEEARKDPRMTKHAARNTHPDIESVQAAYEELSIQMPTIHFDSETQAEPVAVGV